MKPRTFNTKMILTWTSIEAQRENLELNEERRAKLTQMVKEGKTDGIPLVVSDVETTRVFADRAAAEEYKNFILDMDAKYRPDFGPALVQSVQIID